MSGSTSEDRSPPGLLRVIFPREARHFPGQRWLDIGLRTLHLIGLAGLGAAFFHPDGGDAGSAYFPLTLYSGAGLVLLAVWSNGIWLVQIRGLAILFKLLLLALLPYLPDLRLALFLAVIVISGLISHAPARVRHYSVFHRRRIDSLDWGAE